MRKCKLLFPIFLLTFAGVFYGNRAKAQATFPVNGIANPTEGAYAFTNATIVKDASSTLTNATLLIRNKKIIAVGNNVMIPGDAVIIDCMGKYIYPSFIDLYSDYGITSPQRTSFVFNPLTAPQITSNTRGATGWNQAMKPEVNAYELFDADDKEAKSLRDAGFGTVLTHQKDGIARGTGTLVTLAYQPDNFVMLKEKASAQYSFSKGTSGQSYPSSLMGVIALLRQTYLDAEWYKNNPVEEGKNISLAAWNQSQKLPQIIEANDKWNCLRANRIDNEFGVQYILKAGGNEYQRIKEMAATKATFILPLNFPPAMDVEDPNNARYVSLADMENWEMAPTNPAAFEKENINFCLTADGLKDSKTFWANLHKALDAGLSEKTALEALTKNPALALGVYAEVGSIEPGKIANFFIATKPLFEEKSMILQNWIQGEKYGVKEDEWNNIAATYNLVITYHNGTVNDYTLMVKSSTSASVIGKDTLNTKFSFDGKMVQINFSPVPTPKKKSVDQKDNIPAKDSAVAKEDSMPIQKLKMDSIAKANAPADDRLPEKQKTKSFSETPLAGGNMGPSIRLSGVSNGKIWQGNGTDTSGNLLNWTATFVK
ncbi:MAG: amidohydrolase family protein [Ginsengibacter sp.]